MLDTLAWKLFAASALILAFFLTLHRYWSLFHDLFKRREIVNMEQKLKEGGKTSYFRFRKAYEGLGNSNKLDASNPRSTLLELRFGKPLLENKGILEIGEVLRYEVNKCPCSTA
jgi:hypothetical protein